MAVIQNDFLVKNGLVVRNTATIYSVDTFLTTGTTAALGLPSLSLNFTSGVLDSRITFVRASGASVVGANGILQYVGNNTPRFDYSSTSTGTCLGLLIEESRTNLCTNGQGVYSSGLTPNNWGQEQGFGGLTLTNQSSGIDTYGYGYFEFSIVGTTSVMNRLLLSPFLRSAVTAGTTYTFSYNIENRFNYAYGITPTFLWYDSAMTYLSSSLGASYSSVTGWARHTDTVTAPAGAVYATTRLDFTGYGTAGTAVNFTLRLGGIQWEASTFPTSYIPTQGSQATRAAETAVITGSNFNNWYNVNAGTQYIESQNQYNATLFAGTGAAIYTGYRDNVFLVSSKRDAGSSATGSVVIWPLAGSYITIGATGTSLNFTDPNAYYKYAGAMTSGYIAASTNGLPAGTSSQTFVPPIPTMLGFGIDPYAYSKFSGHIKKYTYYPQALSGIRLQSLTSSTVFTGTNFANVLPSTYVASTSNFVVQTGITVKQNMEVPDIDRYYATTLARPTQQPSLNLNFLKGTLDPRITFARASGATFMGANGYIQYTGNNTPRFDYSTTSTGTCLGLLIEESRTNQVLYSSTYVSWITNPADLTANAGIAPDGTLTALLQNQASGGTNNLYSQYGGLTIGTPYTASAYFKQGTKPTCGIQIDDTDFGGSRHISWYNWSTGIITCSMSGTVGQVMPTAIVTILPNGWIRMSITFTPLNGGNLVVMINRDMQATGGTTYVWGVQAEKGAFATSYIPTLGSQVTRAADSASMTGNNFNSWYNLNQSTLYIETQRLGTLLTADEGAGIELASGITQQNLIQIMYDYGSYNSAALRIFTPSSPSLLWTRCTGSPNFSVGELPRKFAATWASGNSNISSNGLIGTPITTTFFPPMPTKLRIASSSEGAQGSDFNGWIRRITYYPEQLTDAQLQSLTA